MASLLFASLCLLLPLAAEEPSAFRAALVEAQRNARHPSGRAFEARVGKEFGATYGPKLSECARQATRPDLSDFEVLVKLSLNGGVEEALVRPETNLALCLKERLLGGSLPVPETAGYWVRIGMKLKR